MLALYRGFSLHQYKINQTTRLNDLELVKLNLLTHIYTRRGERLMMADFGTRIPDLIFEQLTPDAVDLVREDLTYVFNYDPRVVLLELKLAPSWEDNAILATANLQYIELNMADQLVLNIQFET